MMFGLKKIFRKQPKKKVSEMLMSVAGVFIDMGGNVEEKQEQLNCAVSSWNIACLKFETRKTAIKKYLKEYKKLNPTFTKIDFMNEEENVKLLIQQKEKLYPYETIQIVSATIQEKAGKNHVTVASVRMG